LSISGREGMKIKKYFLFPVKATIFQYRSITPKQDLGAHYLNLISKEVASNGSSKPQKHLKEVQE